MQSGKYPGNDWLTKELYKNFWKELKEMFVNSVSEIKGKGPLRTS